VASGLHHVERRDSLPLRIASLFEGIREVVATWQPTQAAVEIVFVNVNPQSTLLLGQARGAAICAAAGGLPVAEYTALQVKQAVVGHGKANKEQVQFMVARLLALARRPVPTPPTRWPAPSATRTAARGMGALAGPGARRRGGRIIARRPA
jgi:crossover junction endodeoxyribonuclease RuvC